MQYFIAANNCFRNENYSKAIEFYNKALLNNEYDEAAIEYNIGVAYLRLREINTAIEYFKKSLSTDPNRKICYFNLGYCFGLLKNYKAALLYYKTALSMDGSDIDCIKAVAILEKELAIITK